MPASEGMDRSSENILFRRKAAESKKREEVITGKKKNVDSSTRTENRGKDPPHYHVENLNEAQGIGGIFQIN